MTHDQMTAALGVLVAFAILAVVALGAPNGLRTW